MMENDKKKKKINFLIITGTRPEIIKLSVVIRLLSKSPDYNLIFVHSGQHYDDNMFNIFLKELELPELNYNLQLGSMPNAVQTANIMIKLHDIILKEQPDIIMAQGDTNTVVAAALTSFKSNIPFAHLEAGIRSFDLTMPEEINRMLTAVGAMIHFAPTYRAASNLVQQGVEPRNIYIVGNSIVDAVIQNAKIAKTNSKILETLNIKEKYILVTTHRPSNVDHESNLRNIIDALIEISKYMRIIFPIHPRTLNNLKKFNFLQKINQNKNITLVDPLGYLDFLLLMENAYIIITDSGGLQEEAIILKKPCLTLRENTERPETVDLGANILVGNDKEKIVLRAVELIENPKIYEQMSNCINPFGDGKTSEKILQIIKQKYYNDELKYRAEKNLDHTPRTLLHKIDKETENLTVQQVQDKINCIIFQIFDLKGEFVFPEPELKLLYGWHILIRKA